MVGWTTTQVSGILHSASLGTTILQTLIQQVEQLLLLVNHMSEVMTKLLIISIWTYTSIPTPMYVPRTMICVISQHFFDFLDCLILTQIGQCVCRP